MRADPRQALELGHRSLRAWIDDAAPSMGAALAFYTLLSLAPLLLVAVGLAGFFLGRDEAQDALVAQLALLLGDRAALGIEALLDAAGSRDEAITPALVGAAMMVIGATTVFAELRSDLDRIWRYKAPERGGALRQIGGRAAAFAMVMAIGLALVASMLASTFLASVGPRLFPQSLGLLHVAEFLVSFVLVTLLFAAIYKLLPSQRIAWRDVWVGATVTALLFWLGKFLIALYLGTAAVGSSFGAAGAIVILVVWVYYSAQVFFLGAEFTRQYALLHGSRRHELPGRPPPLGELNAAYEELAARTRRLEGAD